jgi:IS30 family transposase
MSLKEIGRALCRDHATIINSINKFNDRMDTDEDYANRYADFVYYMKRSKSDTKHDKAIKVLELIEGKPTIGGRLNVIKKLLSDGSKVV